MSVGAAFKAAADFALQWLEDHPDEKGIPNRLVLSFLLESFSEDEAKRAFNLLVPAIVKEDDDVAQPYAPKLSLEERVRQSGIGVYGTSTVKRKRRTKAEIAALDELLVAIVEKFRPVTVRQVFYQAVNLRLVPKDETQGYRVVQRRLVALRETGAIPHGYIVDGTRYVHGHQRYNDLDEFASYAAGLYRKDYWATADVNLEVWLEKDALKGVLMPTVVNECGLGLHVTRGFASITYLQEAAEDIQQDGRPTHVYVLTDFDPSGVVIAEKIEEELRARAPSSDIAVERLAVNREQIEQWDLPTRPTKSTDTRASKFRRLHGIDSVELDAIPPDQLRQLVRDAIDGHMEPRRLEQLQMVEKEERDTLREMFGGAA